MWDSVEDKGIHLTETTHKLQEIFKNISEETEKESDRDTSSLVLSSYILVFSPPSSLLLDGEIQ